MRLGEILEAAGVEAPRGSRRGHCMICGRYTEAGHEPRRVFRDTFTEYNRLLHYAGVVCPWCALLLSRQEYRRRSWVASTRGIELLRSRAEALSRLLEPPEPPFVFYVSLSGRKQGWVTVASRPAASRDEYPVSVDGELVYVVRERLGVYAALAGELLRSGASRQELIQGCRPRTWGRARLLCSQLEEVRGDPVWALAARLA